MVQEYSAQIQSRSGLGGLMAVIGQAPDYAQVVREVANKHRKKLFGKVYDYEYTVAQLGSGLAIVGGLHDGELFVGDLFLPSWRSDRVRVAPLVVPA